MNLASRRDWMSGSPSGSRRLKGLRVGVIANPTSVDARMVHIADHLRAAQGVTLAALFGPEHGIRADAQDMIGVDVRPRPQDRRAGPYASTGRTSRA